MTQDEALHLLAARVDGELTPDQEQALDAWLREHPEGQIMAEAFRSQDVELRNAFELRRDGSAVYLDQNTSVRLVSERTVRLERGRIFVEAVPAGKEAGRGSFLVWTPKRKLEALGTKFAVDAVDNALSVFVTQGSVKVE